MLKPLPDLGSSELRELGAAISQDIYSSNQGVAWGDVAGLEGAKHLLREALVMPLQFPDIFTGILAPWKVIVVIINLHPSSWQQLALQRLPAASVVPSGQLQYLLHELLLEDVSGCSTFLGYASCVLSASPATHQKSEAHHIAADTSCLVIDRASYSLYCNSCDSI